MDHSDKRFATESLNKLIFSMVLPTLMAQLINALYNIIDRIYIGKIAGEGELALTGIGITFPILQIIVALSAFAASGGAPLLSRYLGKNDYQSAKDIMQTSSTLMILLSILSMFILYIAKTPLLYLFGASDVTFSYANDYLSIYLVGTVFVLLSIGLNPFISGQGNATVAMLSICIGAISNIILDPIFIFTLNMGVKGAALATILSQGLSAIWIVCYLSSKRSVIKLNIFKLTIRKDFVRIIFILGLSSFFMQSTNSLVNIVFNASFKYYGNDLYIAALTILLSLTTIQFIPIEAFRQGIVPILAYNYGAGNKKRVMQILKLLFGYTAITSVISTTLIIVFSNEFVSIFTSSEELVALGSQLTIIFFAGSILIGLIMAAQGMFIAFGFAKCSIFIALLRKIVVLIPLILILPKYFGVIGIIYAQPIADIVAVSAAIITSIIVIRHVNKSMPDKIEKNEPTAKKNRKYPSRLIHQFR